MDYTLRGNIKYHIDPKDHMIYVAGPVDNLAEVVDRIGQERGLRPKEASFLLRDEFYVLKMFEEGGIDAWEANQRIGHAQMTFGILHRVKLSVDVLNEYGLEGRPFIRYFPNNRGFPRADYEKDFQLIRETFQKVLDSLD